jgi:dipeptidyl aminopeptidase/acylaminoacyl peptidase
MLWSLGRVAPEIVTPDNRNIIYGITNYDLKTGISEKNLYTISIERGVQLQLTRERGGEGSVMVLPNGQMGFMKDGQIWQSGWDGSAPSPITEYPGGLNNVRFSPDGKYIMFSKDVKMDKVMSSETYPDLYKSNVRIIDDLNYRHWDTWEDGAFSHVFFADWRDGKIENEKDIMEGMRFDCPQMPFGGIEDMIWHTDSKHIVFVMKPKTGKEYAVSTNTDIYLYTIETGKVNLLTEGMMGYDTNPIISFDGKRMAWLSMERDGYEADKNRLFIMQTDNHSTQEVNSSFDESIEAIRWSNDGNKIFFTAPVDGTIQLFQFDVLNYYTKVGGRKANPVKQITKGDFDITGMIGETPIGLIVSRTDMNHATEIYRVDIETGEMKQITNINEKIYSETKMSKTERKIVKTTDGKDMLVWFIYPPDFDPNKKYPTLLYCQGGPQSALTQFYSFRWNFQLMAANGYIIVAPNRRGMPGHGVLWNEEISKDWGGQPIRDYFSAIDYAKTLPYVDSTRCGAVGASYGGYSVYMMEGMHNGRFKTFIAHDGLFNLNSFYGTTEEMWFANWDMGGPYWKSGIQDKSYKDYNPINYVAKWDTPILIYQGGRDYRTTEDQAFQAFNAAQLMGIKSRFVYLPDQNHWVTSCHDALAWQREFYKWLRETL